jgi:uncharacterized membrane protein YedE/YeeE
MIENYLVVRGLLGGAMLGTSSAILYLGNGRIAGISGIFGGLVDLREDPIWRAVFVGGLILGGIILASTWGAAFGDPVQASPWMIGLAGLLVGIGTRLGSGCTSGHGICGLSRFSLRSLAATMAFIGSGALTIVILRALGSFVAP